jgi:predicted Zn-dependent peptidase
MIQATTLDNGIRVITEQIPAVHSVALGAWVTAGSRHEAATQTGISHFIEHMLFRGTERRSALTIARELDAVGGCLNAFSSSEHCCYYVKTLASDLPQVVDLLADLLQSSRFDFDEIEKERRVILNEIAQVEDAADDLVHDLFNELLLQGHSLSRPVCGSESSITGLEREDLLAFYHQHYCGTNLVIAAAGCLEHGHIVDLVAAAFSTLPSGAPTDSGRPPRYNHQLAQRTKGLEQLHFCLGTKGLAQNSADRIPLHLLNSLLGRGMSSRLFQSIREKRGLAYSIFSYAQCHSDAGTLVVCAATAPDDALETIRLVLAELHDLRKNPVTAQGLLATQNQLKGSLLLTLEGTDQRMIRLAQNEIYLRRVVPIDEVLRGIDAVTVDDLLRLANKLFTDDTLCLQLLGPVRQVDFSALDLTIGDLSP